MIYFDAITKRMSPSKLEVDPFNSQPNGSNHGANMSAPRSRTSESVGRHGRSAVGKKDEGEMSNEGHTVGGLSVVGSYDKRRAVCIETENMKRVEGPASSSSRVADMLSCSRNSNMRMIYQVAVQRNMH